MWPNRDSYTEEKRSWGPGPLQSLHRTLCHSKESFGSAQQRPLTADHPDVFCMGAVVFPNSGPLAVQQRSLVALTLHIIQEDLDAPVRLPERRPLQHRQRGFEPELPTHDRAGLGGEKVVTHGPPLTADEDLHSASIGQAIGADETHWASSKASSSFGTFPSSSGPFEQLVGLPSSLQLLSQPLLVLLQLVQGGKNNGQLVAGWGGFLGPGRRPLGGDVPGWVRGSRLRGLSWRWRWCWACRWLGGGRRWGLKGSPMCPCRRGGDCGLSNPWGSRDACVITWGRDRITLFIWIWLLKICLFFAVMLWYFGKLG